MKLVAYRFEGRDRLGVLDKERDLVHEIDLPPGTGVSDALLDHISNWDPDRVAAACQQGSATPVSSVRLLPPLPRLNRNIFCVGKNYYDHSEEFAQSGFDGSSSAAVPALPIYFTKPASSVIGPGDPIDPHIGVTEAIDYEVELAVIIGRQGTRITESQAWDHVWGYTILNDVTARDLQRDHNQWFLGKSLDTFCPVGPWAVSADEVDPLNMTVETRVNGEVRQSANTKNLIFDIPRLVSTLSAGMVLYPGDVIATGTPAGVGIGFDPPRFLRPGDEVSVHITGLGTLTNTVDRATAGAS